MNKDKIVKPKKKNLIKTIKKEAKKVKSEWNKALKDLQKFDPTKDIEMPDFKKQLKEFDFKLDSDCKI